MVNVTTTQQAKNILHDAKQDFVSKELRDPIIQKLNRNDTHYDDNNYVLDLFFYMRNNHPFLSLFCVHPKHPYSQGKRFLVSFVTWSLAFLLAALWELIDSGADHFYYQTIISGFLLFLFGTFLSVTAQCSCTQSDKVMKGVRNTASCVSSVLLCQCCCLGLCFAIAGILLVVRPNLSALLPLLLDDEGERTVTEGVCVCHGRTTRRMPATAKHRPKQQH